MSNVPLHRRSPTRQLSSSRRNRRLTRRLLCERLEDRAMLAVLFSHDADDVVRSLVPTDEVYQNLGLDWLGGNEPFDDSAWSTTGSGSGAVGYDRGGAYDSLLGLDVEADMYNASPTVFARAEFDVADPLAVDVLTLRMRYDDGFVAWLNGTEVARMNVTGVYPAWSATATASHQASTTAFDAFDVTSHAGALRAGTNVLAIRAFNVDVADDDALVQFALIGESRTGPPFARNDTATTQENQPVTIEVLANDDEGSNPIAAGTVQIATPPAHGTATPTAGGTIIYTPATSYNGQDSFTYTVRDNSATGVPFTQTFVASNAAVKAFVPPNNNLGTTWRGANEPFNDAGWLSGSLGVGYDTNATGTDFNPFVGLNVRSAMQNVNTTIYMRSSFIVSNVADVTALTLRMRYDDGFAAFINGVQVASAFAPGSLTYNSATGEATNGDANAIVFQTFNLSQHISALRTGANVLAIHGLNQNLGSSDLLMQPELTATIRPQGRLSNAATVTVDVSGIDFVPIARDDVYSIDEGQTLDATATGGGPTTNATLVAAGSAWLYHDTGMLPANDAHGDTWKQTAFDDATWSSGLAQLGYGDGDEATTVNCGPSQPDCNSGNFITTWFRKHFAVEPGMAARATQLAVELLRDDAAAVYLNGVEIVRSNLPGSLGDNAIGPTTPASLTSTIADESTFQPAVMVDLTSVAFRNLLRDGDNVFAVEIHQDQASSSDISFDLRVNATFAVAAGVLGNDTEPDGQTMTASVETPPTHGDLDLASDGTFTYVPSTGFVGVDSFTYLASDGLLSSDPATVTINVRHVPPQGVADSFATDEDVPLFVDVASGVLANDTDTQSHPLTAQLVETTEHGVLTLAQNGSFSYVPDVGFHGIDTFTYRPSDGQILAGIVTVTITVRSIDDRAVAGADSYEMVSGSTLNVDFPRSLGGPIPGGILLTPLGANGQLIYDRHRDILYQVNRLAGSGTIFRYHVPTNTLLAPFSVPGTITEGDITPDGRALYFADTTTGPNVGYIRKISLDDGSLTTLTYSRGGSEAAGHDLAIGANGIARFSTAYSGSGSTPIRRLDTATDTFSGGGDAFHRTNIHSGPDKSLLVYINTQISSYPITTVDGVAGSSIATREFHELAEGSVAAINRNGQLVALICCDAGLNIRDRNLNLVHDFPDVPAAIAFDAARDIFYAALHVANPNPDQFVAYDTNTWTELYRFPLSINPSSSSRMMLTSANGQYAFWRTTDGVYMIDILNVPDVIIPISSAWKYLDDGSNQGTAWREPGFNDRFWPTGNAQLGYGDDDEATLIRYGDDPNAKHPTTYFRRTFQVNDPTALADLTVSLNADDGAAVFINGTPVARRNLTLDAGFADYATAMDGSDGTVLFDFAVDPQVLRQGENVIAVEVHTQSAADADLSFNLRLTANRIRPVGILSNDRDDDGEALTPLLVEGPAHGTLDLSPDGTFTYQPAIGFAGIDSFTYRASSAGGQSEIATVTIDVAPRAGRPAVTNFDYAIAEDERLVVTIPGLLTGSVDPEGTALTTTLTGAPLFGVASIAPNGSFVYTPAADFRGVDAFTFAASDGGQLSNTGFVTITVQSRDDAPVAANDVFSIDQAAVLTFSAPATSAELIAGTSFVEPPVGARSFISVGGEIGFQAPGTPPHSGLGVLASGEYIVHGVSSPFNINFDEVDLSSHHNAKVRLDVRALEDSTSSDFEIFDYFRAVLSLERIGGPVMQQTIVDISGTQLKAIDLGGAYTSFVANIPDDVVSATLTIETNVDSPSERVYIDRIEFEGYSDAGGNALLSNDVDADQDELTATIVAGPYHGALAFGPNGAFTYTPDDDYVGVDQFTYRAGDGTYASNVALVTINVGNASVPPTASEDSYITWGGRSLSRPAAAGILANDTDLNADSLTVAVLSTTESGTLVLNEDGAFTYAPAPGFVGDDVFTYRIWDSTSARAATATIKVLALRDPIDGVPLSTDDVFAVAAGDSLYVPLPGVLSGDMDPERRPLTAVVVSPPWHGTLVFGSHGGFHYTPNAGFTGTDTFTYRASDGNTFSLPAKVTLNVRAVPLPGAPLNGSISGISGGDLNGNGEVTRADLVLLLHAFGSNVIPIDAVSQSLTSGAGNAADLNRDQRVDLRDLIAFRNSLVTDDMTPSAMVARRSIQVPRQPTRMPMLLSRRLPDRRMLVAADVDRALAESAKLSPTVDAVRMRQQVRAAIRAGAADADDVTE